MFATTWSVVGCSDVIMADSSDSEFDGYFDDLSVTVNSEPTDEIITSHHWAIFRMMLSGEATTYELLRFHFQ